ncbi:hypothetical protein R1sor_017048 [Riccia sorocarpa]|uniref:Endonuclease/exonuclease/phosphatase domain-containing protein n=1 Tax=Riccia sorocarpa TaxID=122646 RepID=A0ABD3I9P0_9MARC
MADHSVPTDHTDSGTPDQGLRVFHRRAAIRAFLKCFSPHILLLQETHLSLERLRFLVSTISRDYTVFGTSAEGASGGTAFLVHSSIQVRDGAEVTPKFMRRTFELQGEVFSLAGIHMPTGAGDKALFWDLVRNTLTDISFLLLGDFNNVEVHADSSTRANRLGPEEFTSFFQLYSEFNLFDSRWLANDKIGPKWTRKESRNGQVSWARLDRIYTSLDLFQGDFSASIHHAAFQSSYVHWPHFFLC